MAGHPCWNRLGRIEPRPEWHGGKEREVEEGENARHQRLRLAAGLHAQPTQRYKRHHKQRHQYLGEPAAETDRLCRRSEEHTSELQSLMRISYAVFCLKKKNDTTQVLNLYQSQHITTTHQQST